MITRAEQSECSSMFTILRIHAALEFKPLTFLFSSKKFPFFDLSSWIISRISWRKFSQNLRYVRVFVLLGFVIPATILLAPYARLY